MGLGLDEVLDVDHLIHEIFKGLEKVKKMGIKDVELGIDTWAVDYVLVGENGHKLEDPISYRDKRTHNAIQQLTSDLPKEYIYEKTGIQFQDFNTLYQLYKENHDLLAKTDKIMMMPDYLGYVLIERVKVLELNASLFVNVLFG